MGIKGASSDSRSITPGDMFVAITGQRHDGHKFVPQAFSKGAICALVKWVDQDMLDSASARGCALLVSKDPIATLGAIAGHYRTWFDTKVVGVTGSTGKTTTKDMIHSVLSTGFNTLSNVGNLNTAIGVPLTLLRLRKEHEVAVVEMGMRGAGEISYLAELARPEIGVVTNVGQAHIELLGTLDNIRCAKAELLNALPEGGLAVLNRDDSQVVRMQTAFSGKKLWYGLDKSSDVRAEDIENLADEGMRFALVLPDATVHTSVPLPGLHNVSNALAAAAVGHLLGLPAEQISAGLERSLTTSQRSEVIRLPEWLLIDDSYNASPVSNKAALQVLKDVAAGGRTVAVLGDMYELGAHAKAGHEEVGRAVASLGVSVLITVGELSEAIAESAVSAGHGCVTVTKNNDSALDALFKVLQRGDTILIKGSRGMQMEDIVCGLKAAATPDGTR